MSVFIKMLQVFFLAMVKYFYAPIYGLAIKLGFWHTYFALILGGVFAFLLYYYISYILQLYTKHFMPSVNSIIPEKKLIAFRNWKKRRKEKRLLRKKFTRWNKFLVKLKVVYGMWGVILLTPVLISLPVGAFLLRKYYLNRKFALSLMIVSIIIEGFILCLVYWQMSKI